MITKSRLIEICTYCPETGEFFGIIDRGRKYKAGEPFGRPAKKGYLQVTIDGSTYQLQRLAWLYVHGKMPVRQIDHINGITSDNRIDNLRLATRSEQAYNRSSNPLRLLPKNIKLIKSTGNYQVTIEKDGVVAYCKTFSSLIEATEAACKQRMILHGDFARA